MELAGKTHVVTSSRNGWNWTLGLCSVVWLMFLVVFSGSIGFGFGFVSGFGFDFVSGFGFDFVSGFGFDFVSGFGFDFVSGFGFVSGVRFDFIFVLCFSCCSTMDSIWMAIQWDRVTWAFDRSLKSIECFSTTRGLVGFARLYSAVFRCTRMQHLEHICILHPSSRLLRQLRVLHLSAEGVGSVQDSTGSLVSRCSFEA